MKKQMEDTNNSIFKIKELEINAERMNLENISLKESNAKYMDLLRTFACFVNKVESRADSFIRSMSAVMQYDM